MSRIEGGAHLGVVRNWLKWHAKNGETVTWGSDETLEMKRLTPRDMEQLAQDIADAVKDEISERIQNEERLETVLSSLRGE